MRIFSRPRRAEADSLSRLSVLLCSMKTLLLFTAILLAAVPVIAQNSPAAPPDLLPTTQAAPDTVAAIHRLFAARRGRSYILTAVIVGPGALVLLAGGSNAGAGEFVYAIAGSPYELANLICHRRYRKKAEKRAVLNFQEHHLSPKIRRRLKPKYFVEAPAIRRF